MGQANGFGPGSIIGSYRIVKELNRASLCESNSLKNEYTVVTARRDHLSKAVPGLSEPDSSSLMTGARYEAMLFFLWSYFIRFVVGGATCVVYEAVRVCGGASVLSEDATGVALKVLHPGTCWGSQSSPSVVQREIASAASLHHGNVARLLEAFTHNGQLVMVWELIRGPDLLEFINHCPGKKVPEALAARYFAQLLSAVSHIHGCGLCHRDLKPENCMLDVFARALKVIDFGLAHYITSARTVGVGTPDYMAPEMIRGAQLETPVGCYDPAAVDVWGLGIILYLMVLGSYPFQDPEHPRSVVHTVRNIVEGRMRMEGLAGLSEECAHLIQWLLANNATDRPSLEQISQHPWLALMSKRQAEALDLERELLRAPSATEDLLGAGLTVWLNDLAKADTLPRLEPCQQWRWGDNKEEEVAAPEMAWQSIHHERVKSDDSTQSAWTDEELLFAEAYMSSDAEDDAPFSPSVMSDSSTMQDAGCTPDAPKLHDSASTLAEGLHGDVQTSSATACRHEADEAVSMPLCSTPRLPRRICGHDLSIAELKAALGSACGRQVGGQDYSHSRPTASKPPVWSPPPRPATHSLRDRLSKLCQFRQQKRHTVAKSLKFQPFSSPPTDSMEEEEDCDAWACA